MSVRSDRKRSGTSATSRGSWGIAGLRARCHDAVRRHRARCVPDGFAVDRPRSRCSPTLDAAAAREGAAPIEKDGEVPDNCRAEVVEIWLSLAVRGGYGRDHGWAAACSD